MGVKKYLEKKGIRSKIRTTKDGRTYGGAIYSRGALYQILNNRMYIGKIVHRGEVYVAQHEPIITQKLWDQVGASLKANNRAKRTSRICATSSLLTGLLRDADGIRLTPTHAVKKGKRYRYYTSQAVIQKHGDRPRIARYPAMEIETVVTAQIHRMLKSFDTYLTGNKKTPQGELAVQGAKDLSVRWPKLATTEQREFIRTVVMTVRLGQKNLWIEVDKLKIMGMLTGKSPDEFREPSNRKPDAINLTADFQPVRRGGELKVHSPNDRSKTGKPIPSLVKTVARARMWYEQLISGEASSVEDLARRAGFKCRYMRKVLQGAVLSPDISEAILSGRQALHLTVKNLQSGLPLDWQQQRRDLLVTA
jgi:hypothetical protein